MTLYLDVDERRESLPGTEQKTSVGAVTPDNNMSLPSSLERGGTTRIKLVMLMRTEPTMPYYVSSVNKNVTKYH